MIRYTLVRLLQIPLVLLGLVTVLWLVVRLAPGDPVLALVGDFPAPDEYVRKVRQEFGLDRSLPEQFVRYVTAVATGDLGFSFVFRRPVLGLVLERAGATALLTATALGLASLSGISLGILAARRPFSMLDGCISGGSVMGFSVPVFWLGQLLILLFAVTLGWFPAQGMVSLRESPEGWARVRDVALHLILPAAALSLRFLAMTARLARASMLEVLGRDYVRTAQAKGASPRRVLFAHAFPNAALPVLTLVGYNLGFVLAGSALVETVFGWPGMGRLLYDSVFSAFLRPRHHDRRVSRWCSPISPPISSTPTRSAHPLPGMSHARPLRRAPGVAGLALVVLLLVSASLAPAPSSRPPLETSASAFRPPGRGQLLGTDNLGRDVWSGLLHGARVSLLVGVLAAGLAAVIGVAVGAAAGAAGGRIDALLMRLSDLLQTIPQFFLALLIVALAGRGLWKIIAVLAILGWPLTARLVRAEFLSLREQECSSRPPARSA
jgi:peptide/nickel transport system permease protein